MLLNLDFDLPFRNSPRLCSQGSIEKKVTGLEIQFLPGF